MEQLRHALPTVAGDLLGDDARLVEHVAQPEHQGGTAVAGQLQARLQLAGRAVRMAVDDHDVRRGQLDLLDEAARACLHGLLERQLGAVVAAGRVLEQRRHTDDLDPGVVADPVEPAGHAGDQHDAGVRVTGEDCAGDQRVAPDMAEPEAVVGVEQVSGHR